ncbi:hypothetical protein [Aliamphritea ceti]|uniref:hypothetical protein n=1 Tax=Aliamphritea ceti TaxID=1524258 RepID=UPI0021C2A8CF|nr:hypothetical protein [Aliamphritea ceti]
MTAQTLLQRMNRIKQAVPLRSALYQVMNELHAMANSDAYSVTFTAANNPNTVPVFSAAGYSGYSADTGNKLIGAHVTFKDDLPSFVHELTHARCIQCYKSEAVNYAQSRPNTAAMTFGMGAMPGAPAHTVSLVAESIIARRTAWYRQDYKLVLEGNLTRLKAIAETEDYEETENKFMTRVQKQQLKAAPTSVEQMNEQQTLAQEMQYQGRVQKTLRTWKPATENQLRLRTEAERKKSWILERINYGKNGMGGLGDVHFEYDTVVNQMLVQMHAWGFDAESDLFTAVSTLAQETHERRMSAMAPPPNAIPGPRSVLT